MTDRELLELAAKAAGVYARISWTNSSGQPQMFNAPFDFVRKHGADDLPVIWDPLTDDGDALRLAVKLHVDFKTYQTTVRTWIGDPKAQKVLASIEELCGDDPYAATRRAIVRAAAEIGKEMK